MQGNVDEDDDDEAEDEEAPATSAVGEEDATKKSQRLDNYDYKNAKDMV